MMDAAVGKAINLCSRSRKVCRSLAPTSNCSSWFERLNSHLTLPAFTSVSVYFISAAAAVCPPLCLTSLPPLSLPPLQVRASVIVAGVIARTDGPGRSASILCLARCLWRAVWRSVAERPICPASDEVPALPHPRLVAMVTETGRHSVLTSSV